VLLLQYISSGKGDEQEAASKTKEIKETEMETTKVLASIDRRWIFISTILSKSFPTPNRCCGLTLSHPKGNIIQEHCLCHEKLIELCR
jgi:hypothetical protein